MPSPHDYELGRHLDGLQQTGDKQWICNCPTHDDSTASLSVGIGENNKLLLHCQAGCSTAEIVRHFGLGFSSLFAGPPPQSNGKHPRNSKRSKGKSHKPPAKVVATYDYTNEHVSLLYQSVRFEPKDFRQRRPDPAKKGRWVWSVKDCRKVLYRLPEIVASSPETTILVVEGEKDVDNLRRGGFVATCNVGGAGKWLPEYTEQLRGRHVAIIPDNDDAGRKHAEHVAGQLAGVAASVKIVRLDGLPEKGDVSDWITAGHKPQELRDAIEAAPLWEKPDSASDSSTSLPAANESDDDPYRLARLFAQQYQHTDGRTLAYWMDSYHRWDGAAWRRVPTHEIRAELGKHMKLELDRINRQRLASPQMSDGPPPQVKKITRTMVGDAIQALASLTLLSDRHHQPSWLAGPHVDRNPKDFIVMANGVLDLQALLDERSADEVLLPHSPLYFSPICLPFDFDPDATCPQWLAFVQKNLEQDNDRMEMLQEWFGYCLTPDTSQQKFLLMEGEGSNGKSVICAALAALLGAENVCHVPLEVFGQRFALTQTIGKLANIASEVGDIDKIAEGFLKSFTSGDRMTFDRKNQTPIEAVPTARLVLSTNNRPRFADRSGGIWRRMLLLPLKVEIKDHEKVHDMDKPDFWERSGELPGIFMWAVTGLSELRKYKRFTEPEVSKKALEEYRTENNSARAFLEETCKADETAQVHTQVLYKAYQKWCQDNGKKPFASSEFGKDVLRKFPDAKKQRIREEYNEDGEKVQRRSQVYSGVFFENENPYDHYGQGFDSSF